MVLNLGVVTPLISGSYQMIVENTRLGHNLVYDWINKMLQGFLFETDVGSGSIQLANGVTSSLCAAMYSCFVQISSPSHPTKMCEGT